MHPDPCPLCGYEIRTRPCPHCGETTSESSLAGAPHGPARGLVDGLWAVPRGFLFLATTRGTKRLLIPPFLLTSGVFAALLAAAWAWVRELLAAARLQDVDTLGLDEGPLRRTVDWLIHQSVILWIAEAGGILVFLVVSSFVAMWTFSIVYEALSGPFLDEIQGRLEKRWLGANPRDDMERPTDLPASRCVWYSTLAGTASLGLLGLAWWLSGSAAWVIALLSPAPFAIAALWEPEYGKWLRWVVSVEGRTLWTSVKASLLAGVLLVLFLPLRLLPFGVGYLLFGAVCGFTTALSLLDIPFSRRDWTLRRRFDFLRKHWLAMTAYGAVASLVFVVPLIGPILLVPAASVGGLWLVCRLTKPESESTGGRVPDRAGSVGDRCR